jgi:putative salt-induced outer membrane protein
VPATLLAVATPAAGQKAEPLHEDDPFAADLTFGFTLTQGNSETTSLNVGATVEYLLPGHEWKASGLFLRSTDGGDETANRGSGSARYDFKPSDRVFLYGRFGASYNRQAGLDRRLAPGLGAGYDIVRTPTFSLSLGGGLNWIHDQFADASRTRSVFVTVGQDLSLKVNSTTELKQSLSWSPRPDDPRDYLVRGEAILTTALWRWIGIRFAVLDDFDSTPFVDPDTGERRSRNDLTVLTGLNLRF